MGGSTSTHHDQAGPSGREASRGVIQLAIVLGIAAAYDRAVAISEGVIMRSHLVVLAAALILAPPGARAADLVVWWDKG
jgi:hypothetical protein